MPYFIALKKEDHYTIVPEHFGVRSNAQKYAERMGWKDFWIATEEQKAMIEAGATSVSGETSGSSGYRVDLTVPEGTPQVSVESEQVTIESTPDVKWMKEEGIPWHKKGRKAKKK